MVDFAEMRDVERIRAEGADLVERILPNFQMNVWGREWRDRRSSANENAGNIPRKNGPFGLQPIGVVMLCVARRVKHTELLGAESQLSAVLDRNDMIFLDCPSGSP